MRAQPIPKIFLLGPDSRAPSARRCRLFLLGSNKPVPVHCPKRPCRAPLRPTGGAATTNRNLTTIRKGNAQVLNIRLRQCVPHIPMRPGTRSAARRRHQRIHEAAETTVFGCAIEALESRLLLTVVAPASATVLENGSVNFASSSTNTASAITVTDPLATFRSTETLTLSVQDGTLTLGSTSRYVAAGMNDSGSMTVRGPLFALKAALNGLVYQPDSGYSGEDSLQIKLNGGGNHVGEGSATVLIFVNNWSDLSTASQSRESKVTGGQGIDLALQLPNGDLMVHGSGTTTSEEDEPSADWYEITPDDTGSYVNGTWTTLASMNAARMDFSTDVLPNGQVLVVGGEFASDGKVTINNVKQYSDSVELFTPAYAPGGSGSWEIMAPDPHVYNKIVIPGYGSFTGSLAGAQPSEVLPDGNVLVGDIFDNGTEIYDPSLNSWKPGPNKVYNDQSANESWVKLPNGDILTYDIYASIAANDGKAELYNPTTNEWSDASDGNLRLLTSTSTGDTIGPGLLLPSSGEAFFAGGNGRVELYNPSSGQWTADEPLPSIPVRNTEHVGPTQLTMGNAPGAILPNGDLLLALSAPVEPSRSGSRLPADQQHTYLFELNPVTGVYTNVTPAQNQFNTVPSAVDFSMLVVPSLTGQVMITNSDIANNPVFYTLCYGDGPNPAWLPQPFLFTTNAPGHGFTITGSLFNGMDEGASDGANGQMAENFPVVMLLDEVNNKLYFATTVNWSSTGVSTGPALVSVTYVPPAAIGNDLYLYSVYADGIGSDPLQPLAFGTNGPGYRRHLAGDSDSVAASQTSANGNSTSGFAISLANLAAAGSLDALTQRETTGLTSDTVPADTPPPAIALPSMDANISNLLNEGYLQWSGLNAALEVLNA
jgi:hypothetical protein